MTAQQQCDKLNIDQRWELLLKIGKTREEAQFRSDPSLFPKSACTKAIPYGRDCSGKGMVRVSTREGNRANG
jgi:hypothetical protein